MPRHSTPAFSLRDVHARRSGTPVLVGVTAELPAGKVSVLAGPSGSGKTSLLRLLNRLDERSQGTIEVEGRSVDEIPVRELRRRVGFVFQQAALFPGTVQDNLREALEVAEVHPDDEDERIQEALADAELPSDFRTRPARNLSGGEAQRVGLARALVLRPRALLLDEPTSALDAETADRVVGTIREMSARRGLTVVVSTHRLEEARQMADLVLLLEEGRVARTGGAGELLPTRDGQGA